VLALAETKAEDNVVFVGKKPVMSYVLAVTTQLNSSKEVIIKSRGQAISRAVDTAEIVRNRFMPEVKVKSITIDTEEVKRDDGTTMNVSSMEITLQK
jgi:DNA-binding protein